MKRNKIVGALGTLALASSLLTGASLAVESNSEPAEAASRWNCKNTRDNSGPIVFLPNLLVNRRDVAKAAPLYTNCVNSKSQMKAKPFGLVMGYNAEGSTISCNPVTGRLDGFRFDWYFWHPKRGTSYDPGSFSLPCDESTIRTRFVRLDPSKVPWFRWGPGVGRNAQPRWKVVATRQNNNLPDTHKSHWQRFSPLK